MIHIGVAGCGKIAQVRHLPEYHDREDVCVWGLYDLNPDRTQSLAKQYHAKAYASYEDMLSDPDLDAVSICSANAFHADMAIAALKAGKHVLCEKPMATTMEDCERMVQTARETGKVLMIAQNQRLAAAHLKARELVADGAIGRLITFTTAFRHGGPETWTIDPGANTWFFDQSRAVMGAMACLFLSIALVRMRRMSHEHL